MLWKLINHDSAFHWGENLQISGNISFEFSSFCGPQLRLSHPIPLSALDLGVVTLSPSVLGASLREWLASGLPSVVASPTTDAADGFLARTSREGPGAFPSPGAYCCFLRANQIPPST
jgi:hypothetical protein